MDLSRRRTLLLAVVVFAAMALTLGAEATVPERTWSNIGWYWCQWRQDPEQGQWEYWCWSDYYGYWWKAQ